MARAKKRFIGFKNPNDSSISHVRVRLTEGRDPEYTDPYIDYPMSGAVEEPGTGRLLIDVASNAKFLAWNGKTAHLGFNFIYAGGDPNAWTDDAAGDIYQLGEVTINFPTPPTPEDVVSVGWSNSD